MSSRLQLVFSRNDDPATALSRVKCKMLRGGFSNSLSTLTLKLERLQRIRPGAVAVVEKLVNDILADYEEDEADHRASKNRGPWTVNI